MEKTKVAIVGLGTVGSGVAKLLLDFGDRTARHAGRTLWLERVVVRDLKSPRQCELPDGVLTDNLEDVTGNPEIKVVAQLIGGLEPARTIMLKLLESGKDVVTANKALLAEHGPELFDRARELGRSIAFEASVAGGIPIVANIGQCLSANQIQEMQGILNGTSNYILTQMEEEGSDYETALAEAQRLGYAEADPTMDVDGSDAAQKLAILAQLAFGARTNWRKIPRSGIDALQVEDIKYTDFLGYRIKLLAVAQMSSAGLELHVSPTLLKQGTPVAEVRGAFNAVSVVGDAVGPVFFYGQGAGQMPTASAVVADMIDTAVGRTAITFRTLELWAETTGGVKESDYSKVRSKFYLRLNVEDRPGVLGDITSVLGKHGVSIASVLQLDGSGQGGGVVPLVIMTHETSVGEMDTAAIEINQLKGLAPGSVRMRVRD